MRLFSKKKKKNWQRRFGKGLCDSYNYYKTINSTQKFEWKSFALSTTTHWTREFPIPICSNPIQSNIRNSYVELENPQSYRGLLISSSHVPKCSFHMGNMWVLANVNTTRGTFWGNREPSTVRSRGHTLFYDYNCSSTWKAWLRVVRLGWSLCVLPCVKCPKFHGD